MNTQPNPDIPIPTRHGPLLNFVGPPLQRVVFNLKSNNPDNPNAPNHRLTIASELPTSANFAFIQGTWQGDGPNPKNFTGSITVARPNVKNFTGSITEGAVSITTITCSWGPNGMGGVNTLIGEITPVSSPVFPSRWELNGQVVVTDGAGNVVSGGPGMVSGEGAAPVVVDP